MASQDGDDETSTISSAFDKYLRVYEGVEKSSLSSSSDEIQGQVRNAIEGLEKVTIQVSELGVFSLNETVSELPTSSLKLLLLPVLLGSLTMKNTHLERLEVLRLSAVYFKDFINRCNEYKISHVRLSSSEDEACDDQVKDEKKLQNTASSKTKLQELEDMARHRQEKIHRFNEKKSIDDALVELKKTLSNPSHDEDIVRDYYLAMIKTFVLSSMDELESIQLEQNMLKEMAAIKVTGKHLSSPPKSKPLKPFLLTRNEVQKKVFGLGYPSMPAMTVQEFYNQRVMDGLFPDPDTPHQQAAHPSASEEENRQQDEDGKREEEQDRREDDEELGRLRARDDWRDTHRTGWGNTYNRS